MARAPGTIPATGPNPPGMHDKLVTPPVTAGDHDNQSGNAADLFTAPQCPYRKPGIRRYGQSRTSRHPGERPGSVTCFCSIPTSEGTTAADFLFGVLLSEGGRCRHFAILPARMTEPPVVQADKNMSKTRFFSQTVGLDTGPESFPTLSGAGAADRRQDSHSVPSKLLPQRYPRRVLLAVSGLSPQILTETVYALAVAGDPAFVPTEIHLITTAEGADYARHTLLPAGMDRLGQLLDDYGLSGQCHFDADSIHVIADAGGTPLPDIQSPDENLHAADAICHLVRRFTLDRNTALHVSIAGGRKTMGFFMGYALSLFGRPQDRLSHVLVSPPFESNHDFYYPPPTPRVLFDRNNKPINTADAHVVLADIPFVRLRQGLPAELIEGEASFGAVVDAAQASWAAPSLVFDMRQKRLACAGRAIPMPPSILAFYLLLAGRKRRQQPPVRYTDADPQEFLAIYAQLAGPDSADYERATQELRGGMDKEFFEQRKSRANTALKRVLGPAADIYRIQPVGARPLTRFEIGLAAEAITIIDTQGGN